MKTAILKLIAAAIVATALATPLHAQNSIDRLVENCATMGGVKFSSTVVRDPDTREVVKVVKMLKMTSHPITKFLDAFKAEAQNNDVHTTSDGATKSMVISCTQPSQNRIYMLQYDSQTRGLTGGKVTIIIKYNKK